MAIELFPHNQDTYNKMIALFRSSTRVGIVQPTGTGKSFLYLKWIEDHPTDTFTILSPSTEIFTQLQEYAEASGAPDLLDNVEMISYQALLKMSNKEVRSIHPDKMVLDEFHRTGAEQWGPSLQRLLDANPHTQVLGASATPVRYLDNSKDMASELFDRNLAVEMTLGEAVQRKILPTPTYVPVWYDIDGKMDRYEKDVARISNIKKRSELEEKLHQLKRRLEASYGAEDIFQKLMPHDHGKFIVFCRSQEHLAEMMQTMPKWLAGVNSNIHSYVSISAQEDKDDQLKSFKTDQSPDAVKLLFTIDRLNEGLHVKGIDGVIMLRPTTSPIVYLQQMGRALSVGHEKPLVFDFVNNYLNVSIPLREGLTTNVFEKEFRDSSEQYCDVEEFKIFEYMVEFTTLFSELEDTLYFSYEKQWNEYLQLYKEFKAEYGQDPKQREVYEGVNLGQWVCTQRAAFKRGTLSEERKQKLLTTGFILDASEAVWQENYILYKEFKFEYKRDPLNRETYKGANLGVWVQHQRHAFKNGFISEENMQKLLAIGFIINPREAEWQNNYELYIQFKTEYGQEPRHNEFYQEAKIGQWVCNQRRAFKRGTLSEERKQKLLTIGFILDTYEAAWQENYVLYKEFKDKFVREPMQKEIYNGVNLGIWATDQRVEFKKGTLSEERKQKLLAIGFIIDPLEAAWQKNYEQYKEFKRAFGWEPKQGEIYQGVNLGMWVHHQRQAYKKGTLSEERKQTLVEAGFDFKVSSLDKKNSNTPNQAKADSEKENKRI